MRTDRMRPRLLEAPARGRRISIHLAVPGVALSLAAAVALIFAIVGLTASSSAHLDPVDPAHQPWVSEGPAGRSAVRDGWTYAEDPGNNGGRLGWAAGSFAGKPISVPYVAN